MQLIVKSIGNFEKILPLKEEYPKYEKSNIERGTFIQECNYAFDFQLEKGMQSAVLYLNGTNQGVFHRQIEGTIFSFNQDIGENLRKSPFLLNYGYVLFELEIFYSNGVVKSYFSKYCLCSSKNEDNNKNIKELLKQIEILKETQVNSFIHRKDDEAKLLVTGTWRKKSFKTLEQYILLLEEILSAFHANYVFFKSNSYHKIEHKQQIMSYEKMKKFSSSDFRWLMQNSDSFIENKNGKGIKFHDRYFFPYRVMGDVQHKNYNIYENQVILAFLAILSDECSKVQNALNQQFEEFVDLINLSNEENTGPQVISILLLTQKENIKRHLDQLGKIEKKLKQLFVMYQTALGCKVLKLTGKPRKTKIFQEIKQYREIFDLLLKWIDFGEYTVDDDEVLYKIKTLDRLYEYFCLLKLITMFIEKGWKIPYESAFSYKFNYNLNNKFYNDDYDFCNTFLFEKNGIRLTLYYQPVIWGNKITNELHLFRTTLSKESGRDTYFTPDFVIKIQYLGGKEVYAILDAKYADYRNVLDCRLSEIINKYMCQIAGANSVVNLITALQGKISNENKLFIYQGSTLFKQYATKPVVSSIPLNTQDEINRLWNVLDKFLFENAELNLEKEDSRAIDLRNKISISEKMNSESVFEQVAKTKEQEEIPLKEKVVSGEFVKNDDEKNVIRIENIQKEQQSVVLIEEKQKFRPGTLVLGPKSRKHVEIVRWSKDDEEKSQVTEKKENKKAEIFSSTEPKKVEEIVKEEEPIFVKKDVIIENESVLSNDVLNELEKIEEEKYKSGLKFLILADKQMCEEAIDYIFKEIKYKKIEVLTKFVKSEYEKEGHDRKFDYAPINYLLGTIQEAISLGVEDKNEFIRLCSDLKIEPTNLVGKKAFPKKYKNMQKKIEKEQKDKEIRSKIENGEINLERVKEANEDIITFDSSTTGDDDVLEQVSKLNDKNPSVDSFDKIMRSLEDENGALIIMLLQHLTNFGFVNESLFVQIFSPFVNNLTSGNISLDKVLELAEQKGFITYYLLDDKRYLCLTKFAFSTLHKQTIMARLKIKFGETKVYSKCKLSKSKMENLARVNNEIYERILAAPSFGKFLFSNVILNWTGEKYQIIGFCGGFNETLSKMFTINQKFFRCNLKMPDDFKDIKSGIFLIGFCDELPSIINLKKKEFYFAMCCCKNKVHTYIKGEDAWDNIDNNLIQKQNSVENNEKEKNEEEFLIPFNELVDKNIGYSDFDKLFKNKKGWSSTAFTILVWLQNWGVFTSNQIFQIYKVIANNKSEIVDSQVLNLILEKLVDNGYLSKYLNLEDEEIYYCLTQNSLNYLSKEKNRKLIEKTKILSFAKTNFIAQSKMPKNKFLTICSASKKLVASIEVKGKRLFNLLKKISWDWNGKYYVSSNFDTEEKNFTVIGFECDFRDMPKDCILLNILNELPEAISINPDDYVDIYVYTDNLYRYEKEAWKKVFDNRFSF